VTLGEIPNAKLQIPKSRSVAGAAQKLEFLKAEYFLAFGHWRL
jgi:hypothetical protein